MKGSDNDILALAEKLASRKKELPRLYAWCGTEDFLYEGNLKAWDHVKKLGYDLTCCETAVGKPVVRFQGSDKGNWPDAFCFNIAADDPWLLLRIPQKESNNNAGICLLYTSRCV